LEQNQLNKIINLLITEDLKLKPFIKFISACAIFICFTVKATENKFDYMSFAKDYFAAFNATQMPNATKKDLEHYLSFMTNDVAHQHLPYDKTDTRKSGGKEEIRKGMTYWLATSKEYIPELISINVEHNVIVIQYKSTLKVFDKDSGKDRIINRKRIEVLELDNGKISIIRKYGK